MVQPIMRDVFFLSRKSVTATPEDLGVADDLLETLQAHREGCVGLRYFNPIGAHKSGLIGEDPKGIPNNLMPYISQVAVGKLEKLHVFGNDYNTVDGTGVRDYIHVVDLAIGHVKAIDWALENSGCEAFNLGTGNGTSVLQLRDAFVKASGIDVPYVIDPRRPGDPDEVYANAQKAKDVLGWEATHTVEDMCRSSWNFAKNAR